MKIIEPSADLLTPIDGIASLRFIESLARISHRSEEKQTPDTWKPFLTAVVLNHGDFSVLEHGHATVVFRVDRGVAIELRTHRFLYADSESAYTQESTRFVRYGGKQVPELDFIRPINLRNPATFQLACEQAERNYYALLDLGDRPQEARSVLPNAFAATIARTANFRAWRGFFLVRTTVETHADFRRVTVPLLENFKQRVPLIFDDIEPEARQIDNLRKPR